MIIAVIIVIVIIILTFVIPNGDHVQGYWPDGIYTHLALAGTYCCYYDYYYYCCEYYCYDC